MEDVTLNLIWEERARRRVGGDREGETEAEGLRQEKYVYRPWELSASQEKWDVRMKLRGQNPCGILQPTPVELFTLFSYRDIPLGCSSDHYTL